MKREVWFRKILWSYQPCHWKGWAVLVAVIVPMLTLTILGQQTLDAFGYESADAWPFPIFFFPGWLALLMIAKRHS